MAANGFISTAELNFDTYRANLKQYLKSQSQFQDYNFEGSNFAVLLDILAYNTYMNAFYLNMIGSEMFLDTATLPASIYSHAKELNYTPSSRSSSKSVVTLTARNTANGAAFITVPKFFRLSTSLNGKTYVFSTQDSYTISSTDSFISANVEVYEGKVTKEYFVEANTTSTKTRYILSSSNVDVSSVEVKVRPAQSVNSYYTYSRAFDLYGLGSSSNVYFVQGYSDNKYEIVFGNGITGTSLSPGNIVQITYRDCFGSEGDYASKFTAADTLYDNLGNAVPPGNLSVTTITKSSGGSERESVESIKFNAPRYYTTQNRAVTTEDFTSLIKINFPAIQAVSVYGGETATPKQYGKVIIVLKPFGSETASDLTKESVKNYLRDRMTLSITPVFEDPDFFYVKLNSTVYYNPSTTSKQTSDIKSAVTTAIQNFTTQNLENFNLNLRHSKLLTAIDSADASILSNDTYTLMTKRIYPILNTAYSTIIKYNNILDTSFKLPSGIAANPVVTSSTFTYLLSGANVEAYLEDDGEGSLLIKSGDYSNVIGSVDYENGIVTISDLTVANYTNYISIYARTNVEDIYVQQNQILEIDPNDVTINVLTAVN